MEQPLESLRGTDLLQWNDVIVGFVYLVEEPLEQLILVVKILLRT